MSWARFQALLRKKPAAGKGLILIAPTGGLCNRMRALDSALALAEDSAAELRLLWYRSPNINCGFQDLFQVPQGIEAMVELDLYKASGRFRRQLARYYTRYRFDAELRRPPLPSAGALRQLAGSGARLFLESYQRFYGTEPFFQGFVPCESLRRRVDEIAGSFSQVVGVHVRRTDNVWSQEHSTLDSFVELMRQEQAIDPETRFFLATDSPSTEQELNDLFPGRILTYPKESLDRNDPKAIADAMIDLYSLSRCRKVIGSYRSSFSTTAGLIGNVETVIAGAKEQKD